MLWYFPGTFTDLCLGVVWCALVDIDMDIASAWFRVIARQNGLLLMPRVFFLGGRARGNKKKLNVN